MIAARSETPAVTLSAFGDCREHGCEYPNCFDGVEYSRITLGADKLARFVAIAERQGLLGGPDLLGSWYASLDLLDEAGEIIDSRAVGTEAAWQALNSELRLVRLPHPIGDSLAARDSGAV